jgi:hypothetical protein
LSVRGSPVVKKAGEPLSLEPRLRRFRVQRTDGERTKSSTTRPIVPPTPTNSFVVASVDAAEDHFGDDRSHVRESITKSQITSVADPGCALVKKMLFIAVVNTASLVTKRR